MSTFILYGSYSGQTEEIDTAADEQEAGYLVAEYQMAYGADWLVWAEEGKR